MKFSVDNERYRLERGDCLAMSLDTLAVFCNPTKERARYAVVLTSSSGGDR